METKTYQLTLTTVNQMNRLHQLINKKKSINSIFVTAGYPDFDTSKELISVLDNSEHVDFIELGMPYSDPLADGPVIQETSEIAIENGMTFDKYFEIAQYVSEQTELPAVFMGYFGSVLKYGTDRFIEQCVKTQIHTLIIPDLPLDFYEQKLKTELDKNNIEVVFLVSPRTDKTRREKLIYNSKPFVYILSNNNLTGNKLNNNNSLLDYLKSFDETRKSKPHILGFGIKSPEDLKRANDHLDGGIIGSAFLNAVKGEEPIQKAENFLKNITAKL